MKTYKPTPFLSIPTVVKNLLIVNIIFFAATLMFRNEDGYLLVKYLGVYYFDSPNFRIWQILTYMFMHSPVDYFHIFFNMFALFTFGSTLEHYMGSKQFLKFYFITGLGALASQMLVQALEVYQIAGSVSINPYMYHSTSGNIDTLSGIYFAPMLGASGAIFGLLVAFGVLFPNAELMFMFFPLPIKAKYLIPIYVILELTLGLYKIRGDAVAHFAHLGGALFGFLLIKIWKLQRPRGFYK